MKGGGFMSMIIFIVGFLCLVAATFIVVNGENLSGKEANEKAQALEERLAKSLDEIKKSMDGFSKNNNDLYKNYGSLLDSTIAAGEHSVELEKKMDKIQQKIDWLEIKANNSPKHQNIPQTIKVVLSQDAPLKHKVIYKKVDFKPMTKEQAQLKNIKKKMDELNK